MGTAFADFSGNGRLGLIVTNHEGEMHSLFQNEGGGVFSVYLEGDKVVVISGSPPGIAGSTNDIRVHKVGDAVNGAAPIYKEGL